MTWTTRIVFLLAFLCGILLGRYTVEKENDTAVANSIEIQKIYELMEHQSDTMTGIFNVQQLQLHYIVPHSPQNPNPFCAACIKLGWLNGTQNEKHGDKHAENSGK